MAYAGQTITHPTLGVSIKFLKTHRETNGTGWEVEYMLEPGSGKEVLPHTHLHSDEWFTVIQGKGRFWLNGRERNISPGDQVYLPAGKPHIHPWNTGKEKLVMRNYVMYNDPVPNWTEDIKKMEDTYEHWFHLAHRGKVRKNGAPYLLQSAIFFRALRRQIILSRVPVVLQDVLLTPLALTGKLLGYKSSVYQ
jgi:mannose-6-phosphate isomerase-like protein (cupin superfamily)